MQDWQSVPLFLSREVWGKIHAKEQQMYQVLQAVVQHLVRLGLRCPSEPTQQMIAALMRRRCRASSSDDIDFLRNTFLHAKTQLSSSMSRARQEQQAYPGGQYLTVLPADPTQASLELCQAAFGEAGAPSESEMVFGMEELSCIAARIPMRKTHTTLQQP